MTVTAKKTNGRGTDYRPLKFKRVPTPGLRQPCIIPISHKLKATGYIALRPRDGKGNKPELLHRLVFKKRNKLTAIPKGHEVDHSCGRGKEGCCNPQHLRLLEKSDHRRVSNMMRYADRKEAAWCDWTYYRMSANELAERHGFKPRTCRNWIGEWKREERLAQAAAA